MYLLRMRTYRLRIQTSRKVGQVWQAKYIWPPMSSRFGLVATA